MDQDALVTLMHALQAARTPAERQRAFAALRGPLHRLVRAEVQHLHRGAPVLHSLHEVDDLVQEVLLRIWSRAASCHAVSDRQAAVWIRRVTRNRVLDLVRESTSRPTSDAEVITVGGAHRDRTAHPQHELHHTPEPGVPIDRGLARMLLDDVLGQLTEHAVAVALLRDVDSATERGVLHGLAKRWGIGRTEEVVVANIDCWREAHRDELTALELAARRGDHSGTPTQRKSRWQKRIQRGRKALRIGARAWLLRGDVPERTRPVVAHFASDDEGGPA